jgi:hypothetical protein
MSIKSNEVRRGNLVMYNGTIETVYSITESGCSFFRYKTKNGCVTNSYVWNAIEGIFLTEEWLNKFRFSFGGSLNYRFITIDITATTESYLFCNDPKSNGDFIYGICITELDGIELSIPLPHIKHVHELQNLYFSLMGVEITPIK